MTLRYWGEFRGVQGNLYRIEILRPDDGVVTEAEQIGFAADDTAQIEWSEVDKIEPVQGSCLTLTLDSDSDRKFLDLYTIEVGTIRADVYRNGTLYWSGTLDPELYEEPYAYKQDYDVSVSFSDFAILDRLPWEGKTLCSIRSVIDKCLLATGLHYDALVTYISTAVDAASDPMTFDEVMINPENFYDEDDEPMTLREVLDEVLRPFALRMVQKGGRVYLFDLNAVYAQTATPVVWSDVDASLSADDVYNNVKVTFSPYADAALIDGSLDYDQALPEQPVGTSGELIRTDHRTSSPEGFRIVVGTDEAPGDTGSLTLHDGAQLCRIDSEYSGSNEAAVLWGYRPDTEWRGNAPLLADETNLSHAQKKIIVTSRRFVCNVPDPGKWRLKITLDTLFDVRYNPFESAAQKNEEGNWDRLQNRCNYGYIPVSIQLIDAEGIYRYYYDNRGYTISGQSCGERGKWVARTTGVPTTVNYLYGMAWLSYYDKSNRESASGFGGWKTNKQSIGWYAGSLPSAINKLADGLYIDLPPVSGQIELTVWSGIRQIDNSGDPFVRNLNPYARWVLYKDPKVEIVKANGLDVDNDDIEDSAWINRAAKEDLTIDTILGTMPSPTPAARGLLIKPDGSVYTEFSRGGHTDRLERLLIGTVYSQYAQRRHVLSGTTELLPTFGVLTDRSEPGQYTLLSEVQHLRPEESEIKMVQFTADDYAAIEYKK